MFPLRVILVTDPCGHPLPGDYAQYVIGQRYYLADSWHWPLLTANNLGVPKGVNVGFMDGIPLTLIPMKLLRRLLPSGFYSYFFMAGGLLGLAAYGCGICIAKRRRAALHAGSRGCHS
jgi:hypothetical protein